ncbi:HEPN domain-containing protein [Gluconacetobacter diazotrophicus]|uniref:HEPN domain-containing protein n=1 Tax=Gluconacetobacter diazotrophicus TaxID=33996 RepID=UPI0012FEAD9E
MKNFRIGLIEDMISPNYWKTMKAFDRVGINLQGSSVEQFKDEITTTVLKRNRIVHHNDEASDISFGDVVNKIDLFKKYCQCLFFVVSANTHIEKGS